jgi:energy-coupling factor transporter ATP-binding protein EcfA2
MTASASALLFVETQIRQALVRVLHRSGDTAGTAFFVTRDRLLTCYHVIAPQVDSAVCRATVRVVLPGGREPEAGIDPLASAPHLDIAVLCLEDEATPLLPCGFGGDPGQLVWTSGFQRPDNHTQSDVPTNARLGGRVTVRFEGPPVNEIPGFVLEDATIRPGLSGAPLVDRETGVVIGLVDAERFHRGQVIAGQISLQGGALDGYSISLDDAAKAHPPLNELLKENQRYVRAFGRYLNAPGAQHLCRLQAEAAMRELTNTGQFNPRTYTSRQPLTDQIDSFVQSGTKLLPIVGHTGVGKTTLLGHLAGHLTEAEQPVVLIRGFHIRLQTSRGLDDDIAQALAALSGPAFPGLAALLGALSPTPLVVLLDALNEVVFQAFPAVQGWWSQTINWLAQMNVRVVTTSRLQFWDGLKTAVRKELFFQPDPPPPTNEEAGRVLASRQPDSGIFLGDFTPDEYEEARQRYSLTGSEFRTELARHPFFLGMWSEIQRQRLDQGLGDNPTTYNLLERYAEAMAQRVSTATRQLGPSFHTPLQIWRILRDLGADALRNQTNAIPVDVVDVRLANTPGLLGVLVEEHVMEEGGDNYRFAFDSLAEYLMSQHIATAALTDAQIRKLLDYGLDSQAGAVGLAVLSAEHAGKHTEITAALTRVRSVDRPAPSTIRCLALLLSDFYDANRHFEQLREVVRSGGALRNGWRKDTVEAVSRLVHSSRVPVSAAVDLFRPAFVHDDAYRFEWGHWQDRWSTPEFEDDMGMISNPGTEVLRAFDACPRETMHALVGWLDDRTPVAGSNIVAIADAAAAFLYHRRLLVFDELCEVLVTRSSETAERLLIAVVKAEPVRAVAVLDRWSELGESARDPWVVRLGDCLIQRASQVADEAGLGTCLNRVWNRLGGTNAARDSVFITLVAALSGCPSQRDRMFPLIRDSLLQRAWLFRPYLLLPYIPERWPEVLAVLDNCIEDGGSTLHGEVAAVLKSTKITPEQQGDAVARLDVLVGKADADNAFSVGYGVESLLRSMSLEAPARAALLQVARRCLRELPSIARKCVIYYATSNPRPDAPARLEMDTLLAEAMAIENDEACQGLLIEKLSGQHSTFSALLGVLQPLARRMDRDHFEESVMNCLASRLLSSDYFTEWSTATQRASVGPVFQKLHEYVSAGAMPQQAVEHVAWGGWKSEKTVDGGKESASEPRSDSGG